MRSLRLLGLSVLLGATACRAAAHGDDLQTRVAWTETCPSTPAGGDGVHRMIWFAGLAAVIAPKLIEGAVDSAAAALKAAGEAKTVSSTAMALSSFYAINDDADLVVKAGCAVVVRGVFDDAKGSGLDWASRYDELKAVQRVAFRLEARVEPVKGLKFFQLVPQYLEVDEFQESSLFQHDRDFVAALTMTLPGGAQPFGSATLAFHDLGKGTVLTAGDWRLKSATSPLIGFPAESTDATTAKAKREAVVAPFLLATDILTPPKPKPFTPAPDVYADRGVQAGLNAVCQAVVDANKTLDKQFRINDDRCSHGVVTARAALDAALEVANRDAARQAWAKRVCPKFVAGDGSSCMADPDPELSKKRFTLFTTQLTLSETRQGSKFAAFLGSALGAAKADVSTVLKDQLVPKTQAQKDSDADADRTKRADVMLADLAVTQAEDSLADLLLTANPASADVTAARIAIVKAKIEANKAHRKAGGLPPYPELE